MVHYFPGGRQAGKLHGSSKRHALVPVSSSNEPCLSLPPCRVTRVEFPSASSAVPLACDVCMLSKGCFHSIPPGHRHETLPARPSLVLASRIANAPCSRCASRAIESSYSLAPFLPARSCARSSVPLVETRTVCFRVPKRRPFWFHGKAGGHGSSITLEQC